MINDSSNEKNIYDALDFKKNKWNISSNDDDTDTIGYEKSKNNSSEEFVDKDNINKSKK